MRDFVEPAVGMNTVTDPASFSVSFRATPAGNAEEGRDVSEKGIDLASAMKIPQSGGSCRGRDRGGRVERDADHRHVQYVKGGEDEARSQVPECRGHNIHHADTESWRQLLIVDF